MGGCRAAVGLALLLTAICPGTAVAQVRNLMAPQTTPMDLVPGTGSPGATLVPDAMTPPRVGAPAPLAQSVPIVPAGQVALIVSARYGPDSPPIAGGLTWRVFSGRPDQSRMYRLVKEDKAAAPTFILPAGSYVVHVSFGLASAAKAVQLRSETVREVFELPAGGMRMEGRVGDVRIPPGQITFDIFKGSQFDTAERRPIAQNVITGDVVLVP
jgi:hypothetical protein